MDFNEKHATKFIDVESDKIDIESKFGTYFILGAYFGSATILVAYMIEKLL
jgi:hypothetical protein